MTRSVLLLLPSVVLALPALSSSAQADEAPAVAAASTSRPSMSLAASLPLSGIHFNSRLDNSLQALNATGVTSTTTTYGSSASRFASGTGNILFLGLGTLLPLVEDGPDGREHTLRIADSTLTATLITEALKRIVREKRPNNGPRTSFPSGHATAAFAVATMQAHYHPKQAVFWYGGAALIAASRVDLKRHYTHDVIAGAAVGYFVSRLELKRPRGLLLAPFIHPRREGGVSGVSISGGM